jgi:hypothetical protein
MTPRLDPIPSLITIWPFTLFDHDLTTLDIEIAESCSEELLYWFKNPSGFRLFEGKEWPIEPAKMTSTTCDGCEDMGRGLELIDRKHLWQISTVRKVGI